MLKLELLTTEHCSLCKQVLDLLLGMPEAAGFELTVIDILHSETTLFDHYAPLIPVLNVADHELCAPFSRGEIAHWLNEVAGVPGT